MEKEVLTLHLAEPWYSAIVSAEKMEKNTGKFSRIG